MTQRREPERLSTLVLVFVLVLAGLAAVLPGMWLWGVGPLRFVAPAGVIVWALCLLLFVPVVAQLAGSALLALGRWLSEAPALAMFVLATIACAIVWAFPDRVLFTGDILLRRGIREVGLHEGNFLTPQTMPLDRAIHLQFAPYLRELFDVQTADVDRALGIGGAALLSCAAIMFLRALGAPAGPSFALALAVVFTGALTLFTGYGKAYVELSVIVVAMSAAGLAVLRTGRGWVALALCAMVYLAFHRTGFVVLPAALWAGIVAWRRHRGDPQARREAWIAAAISIVALGLLAPRAIRIMQSFDISHHTPGMGLGPGPGSLLRWIDLSNVAIMLAPLLPATLVLIAVRPRLLRDAEMSFLAISAVSFALLAVAAFPQQGVVRDIDVFAPNAVAWTCLGVAVLTRVVAPVRGAARQRLTAGVAAAALGMTLPWLVHFGDMDRGFARVRAIVAGPPVRSNTERGSQMMAVASAAFRDLRFAEASDAYRDAANLLPNPIHFVEWAVAARSAGRYEEARVGLREALKRNPKLGMAWMMLAPLATAAGDYEEADRAWQAVLAISPGDSNVVHNAALARRELEESRRSVSAPPSPP